MPEIKVASRTACDSGKFFYTEDKSGVYYDAGSRWFLFGLSGGFISPLYLDPSYQGAPLQIGDTITITVTE